MRIGYCQFEPIFGQVETNIQKVGTLLADVRADLVVLPELFATGYQFINRDEAVRFAETQNGPTVSWAKKTAAANGCFLCGGFVRRLDHQVFNSAFLVGPAGRLFTYDKLHLFGSEKNCFDPGQGEFEVYDLGPAKVGMMICFDWIFPESARVLALKGAQIICHPSNLVLPYCQSAMPVRCLENRVFAVTANRIGHEERISGEPLTFTGASQVTGVKGDILLRAGETFEGVETVEVNPDAALDKSITATNDLFADRRPEKYSHVTRRRD